jgi:predicted small integral membrane protein
MFDITLFETNNDFNQHVFDIDSILEDATINFLRTQNSKILILITDGIMNSTNLNNCFKLLKDIKLSIINVHSFFDNNNFYGYRPNFELVEFLIKGTKGI